MRDDSQFTNVATPSATKLTEFCRYLSPGLILIAGDKKRPGGEETPGFELAFEVAARMVECELEERITVWSRRSFLSLCGVRLTGDDQSQAHRWVLHREALGGGRTEAWLEEPLKPNMEIDGSEWLKNPRRVDWRSIFGSRNEVVLLDLENQLGITEMCELNQAAKAQQNIVLSCVELKDAQGKSYFPYSYAELAMRISIEHGIDFSDCAESVVVFEPGGALVYRCRIFQNDRADRAARLNNPDPSNERLFEVEDNSISNVLLPRNKMR